MNKFLSIIFILFLSQNIFSQGYKIDIKIKNAENSEIYLAYYYGAKKYVIDTINLDKNGKGRFESINKLPEGVYLIALESKKYFEFIIPEKQEFYIETDTIDLNSNLSFINSEENQNFNLYQKKVYNKQLEMNLLFSKAQNISDNKLIDSLKVEGKKIENDIQNIWIESAEENKNNFLGILIKSMLDIIIPNLNSSKDSIEFLKKHYFDNIDLADSRLLRSPVLHNKIDYFFKNIIDQNTDSMLKYSDFILKKAELNSETYKYILVYLLRYYENSHNVFLDEFFVKISENYFIGRPDLWPEKYMTDNLKSRISFIKPTLKGALAPEIVLLDITSKPISTHSFNKKYTILFFWDPECDHCTVEVPKMYNLFQKLPNSEFEILSIYISNNFTIWNNYIKSNNFSEWINAYSPHNYNSIKDVYNIYSTPLIIMLDKDKKILEKFIEADELEKYINN